MNISKPRQARFWNKWAMSGAVSIGSPIENGVFAIHMGNVRKGFTKVHMPNLGPYSDTNPAHCLDCGKLQTQWSSISETCIPAKKAA